MADDDDDDAKLEWLTQPIFKLEPPHLYAFQFRINIGLPKMKKKIGKHFQNIF